ncbi:hypothetical protein DIPPA_32932 [Diplonema papillatum]|nr:hypothetical protein DIPPA_32932 [Diplonema papillatum]
MATSRFAAEAMSFVEDEYTEDAVAQLRVNGDGATSLIRSGRHPPASTPTPLSSRMSSNTAGEVALGASRGAAQGLPTNGSHRSSAASLAYSGSLASQPMPAASHLNGSTGAVPLSGRMSLGAMGESVQGLPLNGSHRSQAMPAASHLNDSTGTVPLSSRMSSGAMGESVQGLPLNGSHRSQAMPAASHLNDSTGTVPLSSRMSSGAMGELASGEPRGSTQGLPPNGTHRSSAASLTYPGSLASQPMPATGLLNDSAPARRGTAAAPAVSGVMPPAASLNGNGVAPGRHRRDVHPSASAQLSANRVLGRSGGRGVRLSATASEAGAASQDPADGVDLGFDALPADFQAARQERRARANTGITLSAQPSGTQGLPLARNQSLAAAVLAAGSSSQGFGQQAFPLARTQSLAAAVLAAGSGLHTASSTGIPLSQVVSQSTPHPDPFSGAAAGTGISLTQAVSQSNPHRPGADPFSGGIPLNQMLTRSSATLLGDLPEGANPFAASDLPPAVAARQNEVAEQGKELDALKERMHTLKSGLLAELKAKDEMVAMLRKRIRDAAERRKAWSVDSSEGNGEWKGAAIGSDSDDSRSAGGSDSDAEVDDFLAKLEEEEKEQAALDEEAAEEEYEEWEEEEEEEEEVAEEGEEEEAAAAAAAAAAEDAEQGRPAELASQLHPLPEQQKRQSMQGVPAQPKSSEALLHPLPGQEQQQQQPQMQRIPATGASPADQRTQPEKRASRAKSNPVELSQGPPQLHPLPEDEPHMRELPEESRVPESLGLIPEQLAMNPLPGQEPPAPADYEDDDDEAIEKFLDSCTSDEEGDETPAAAAVFFAQPSQQTLTPQPLAAAARPSPAAQQLELPGAFGDSVRSASAAASTFTAVTREPSQQLSPPAKGRARRSPAAQQVEPAAAAATTHQFFTPLTREPSQQLSPPPKGHARPSPAAQPLEPTDSTSALGDSVKGLRRSWKPGLEARAAPSAATPGSYRAHLRPPSSSSLLQEPALPEQSFPLRRVHSSLLDPPAPVVIDTSPRQRIERKSLAPVGVTARKYEPTRPTSKPT